MPQTSTCTPVFGTNQGHETTPTRACNSGGRSRFQASWNRRKEILIGTKDKVSPTKATARRIYLICKLLGPAAGYYFWLVERIGTREHTRFKIPEAAEANGTNRRAIERYNIKLSRLGFITIHKRSYAGRRTYSEYVLNPINEIIQDDGHATTSVSQRRYDTDVATKRAKKEKGETTSVLPPSSPPQQAAKQTEAVRAVAVGFASKGDEHEQAILTFLKENEPTILSLGFLPKPHSSLARDILRFTAGDDHKWKEFVSMFWPLLVEKAKKSDWLKKNNQKTGFGWLFTEDKENPGQPNLQKFLFTDRYSPLSIPDKMYETGDILKVYGKQYPVRVLGLVSGSLTCYRVAASHLSGTDVEENEYTAHLKDLSVPSEPVVVATAGPSESLAVVERPPTPPSVCVAPVNEDDDGETDPEILALKRLLA